mgnify:CR=1 FL=1
MSSRRRHNFLVNHGSLIDHGKKLDEDRYEIKRQQQEIHSKRARAADLPSRANERPMT